MNLKTIITLISSKTAYHPKLSGDSYICRCPAHPDNNPSLSVTKNSDGKILFKCFAGCTVRDICISIGVELTDLFPDDTKIKKPANTSSSSERKITKYPYTDEELNIVFTKIRVEPARDGSPKAFFFERQENGKVVYNNKGCRSLLYRLPAVLLAIANEEPVYLVEGEKDADHLAQYGLCATTVATSLRWDKEFTELLRYAHVVIFYDYDKTGIKRRDKLCEELNGVAKSLKVVELPGFELKDEHGQDITDWLQLNNIKKLRDIIKNTLRYNPLTKNNPIKSISMKGMLNMKISKKDMILEPFLPAQGLALLYAKRGVGKTHVALGMGYAASTGGRFMTWKAPRKSKVLYIDGEMPATMMQKRLRNLVLNSDVAPEERYLDIITPDLQEGVIPDLSTQQGRMCLDPFIDNYDLIIIDNISTLFRSTPENEAEGWSIIQNWALNIRKRGKSVIFVHHAGKGGNQRGTSKREDALDTVIKLSHPLDYKQSDGARFEVHYEKTRGFYGNDAKSFEVRLLSDNEGFQYWQMSDINHNIN